MKSKITYIVLITFIATLLIAWRSTSPAQAANSDTIIIITTAFKTDGSGENTWEINGSLLAHAGSTMTIEDICKDALSGTFTSNRIESRGSDQWCILKGSFTNVDQLGSVFYSQINPTINRLEISNDTLFYDLDVDPNIGSANVNVEWKIVAPGKIIKHNAGKVTGCTLFWTLDSMGSQNLHLESKTDGACNSAARFGGNARVLIGISICCCCLLLIIIAAVIVFVVLRKKKTS